MKHLQTIITLTASTLLLAGSVQGQVSEGGRPLSFVKSFKSAIQAVQMPPVDVEALLAQDAIEESKGIPFRFGYPLDVNYNLYNCGTWEELEYGGGIWRLEIRSPGAYSINLLYSRYRLPEGAGLHIYNEDRSMVIGSFTARNNKEHGKFASAPVRGDVCILEYFEPADVRGLGEITISRVVHAYKDIFDFNVTKSVMDFGGSGSCNNNVNCPEGDPWQDEKQSVALILTSGGYRLCSGALVNNTRQDGTPYFLTANHCLGSAESWVFMFNYESPNCDNIDGPTWYTVSGSTPLAGHASSDFALLLLDEQPPDSYFVYYAGWSNEDVASQSSTGIHHPRGDIKKISFDHDSVTSADYLETSGTTHWRVGQWEDGTTEPGSSGSPLFDQNHRIVGQLHGGYASCINITSDWYGKFAVSWDGGGTQYTRLKDWLDPESTGVAVLSGYDPLQSIIIRHTALPNTKDTVNDYEAVCFIRSNVDLVADSLFLDYEIASVWHRELLEPTGNLHEFRGVVPAQPPGTIISYYMLAMDVEGKADTTDIFSFEIEYSAAIWIVPESLHLVLEAGDSSSDVIMVENVGPIQLDYSLTYDSSEWLTLTKNAGSISSGEADTIICFFNSTELDAGLHSADIIIASNDPDSVDNPWIIPVALIVIEKLYICGDVNGDKTINILDTSYLINYIYKGGQVPEFPESADVNSSGNLNLLDVTYLINYLYKGGPEPVCP